MVIIIKLNKVLTTSFEKSLHQKREYLKTPYHQVKQVKIPLCSFYFINI